jgi:hypothetical protein
MSRLFITLLLLAGSLVQTMISPWNAFGALELPVLTGILIYIILHAERTAAFYAAVLTALLHDAFSPAPLGLSIPFFVLLAAAIHRTRHEVFSDLPVTYAIFGAGAAVLNALYYVPVFSLSGLRPLSFRLVILRLAGGLIAGVVVVPLTALVISKLTCGKSRKRKAVFT